MQHGDVNYELESRFADHLEATRWEDLPDRAREQAKRAILWWFATALEGQAEPDQAPLREYVSRQGGAEEATILGSRMRTTAELAGLVNGRAGKAWEHEDKYWTDETTGFAAGCCVVPAAFAAAEAAGGVSGQELATAVALGIDFEARLVRPLGRGYVLGRAAANATYAFGNYGAAVAAAKVQGADAAGFLSALGITHAQSSGNFQGQVEGRAVSLQCGIVVRNGVTAARLAALGMPGVRASISGSCGLYPLHFPNSTVDLSGVLDGLGSQFLGADLAYKAYPCGIVAHPALDALSAIRDEIGGREVESIEVFGSTSMLIMAEPLKRKQNPASSIEAQFSIPWALACILRDGDMTIEHLQSEALEDPYLRGISNLVDIVMSDEGEGVRLCVTLVDGSVLESPTILIARGHPDNPLPTSEMESLFLGAAKRVDVDTSAAEAALELLRHLEAVEDVGAIGRHLSDVR